MILPVAELLATLELEPAGDGRFVGGSAPSGGGPVFGGQLMAQALVAASTGRDQAARTIHTVFARAARPDEPIELDVEDLHRGRTFGSAAVTVRQGDRLCTRSVVLFSADEPDLVHHADRAPDVGPPPDGAGDPGGPGAWEVVVVGDVDVSDPDAVGPPELDVWSRFAGAPADPLVDRALLAFASDGFLIGTAMRPHPGVGQSQAHVSLATGVVSHTLTYHRPAPAADWLLLSHRSPFAGGGRCYGRADVFDRSGDLVASFVQDGMLRSAG